MQSVKQITVLAVILPLLGACATPEYEHWETAKQACRKHGGAIEVDTELGLCFCMDGTMCKLDD